MVARNKEGGEKSRRARRTDPTKENGSKEKKTRRKLGSNDSETRTLILEAAEQLLKEEGYAAVTSRRLGAKAGVNAQLIHYYFRSMDNLFFEIYRRYTEANVSLQAQAFLSEQPLRTLWESSLNQPNTTLGAEIMALARHRKELRAEIARSAEAFRRLQAGALVRVISDYGLKEYFRSPEILSVFIAGLSRILVVEDELGISLGHSETRELIEDWINSVEGERSVK